MTRARSTRHRSTPTPSHILVRLCLAGAFGLAALVAGDAKADASPMTDITTNYDVTAPSGSGMGRFWITVTHTNNTPGAVYDSAELKDVFFDIASRIVALNPNTTVLSVLTDFQNNSTITSGSEVDNGWSGVVAANGDVRACERIVFPVA